MIEPTEDDIGRGVIYRPLHNPIDGAETGVISSFNDKYVFVRYGSNRVGTATYREHLDWEMPQE
jgi:hypothetical protein